MTDPWRMIRAIAGIWRDRRRAQADRVNCRIGEYEMDLLRAVKALQPNAYGVTIQDRMMAYGHTYSVVRLYATIEKLESCIMVTTRIGDPTPERGNRPKKFAELTPLGELQIQFAEMDE